jgi:4-diphosphocytidyl-2-C-methyl-D-erythritol kinase
MLSRFAPAKINLYLHVGPPNPDGRHPLDSLVVFARDAGDTLHAAAADELSLSITGPFADALPVSDDNLVLRAARLLADHAGRKAGAALTLDKHLPIASGIGGGSADAAAVLHLLNEIWRVGASAEDLARLSAGIGADLPVCVRGETARLSVTGEDTSPTMCPMLHAVLVNPRAPTPTGAVYRQFDALNLGRRLPDAPETPRGGEDMIAWLANTSNDLEPAAEIVTPEIGATLALMRRLAPEALVRMSGSGATCFALAPDAQGAEDIAGRIATARPDWWVKATRLG